MKLTVSKEIEISSVKKLCYYLEDNLPDRKTIGIFLTVENRLVATEVSDCFSVSTSSSNLGSHSA